MQRQIILYLIFYSFIGCSVVRKIDSSLLQENRDNLSANDKLQLNNIHNKSIYFEKIRITVGKEKEKKEFLINAKFKGNDSILISVRSTTGIELARIFLSEDSVKINDKINRIYYYGKQDGFIKKYKIDKNNLALLIGDFIYTKIIDSQECYKDNKRSFIKVILDNKNISYTYDCQLYKITKAIITGEIDTKPVVIDYVNFKRYDKYFYPEKVIITGLEQDQIIQIVIKDIIIPYNGYIKFSRMKNYESVVIE